MSRICHAHCPPEGGTLAAGVAVIAVVAAALRLGGIVTALLPLILWTLVATLAGSVVVLVLVLRRPGVYRVSVPVQEARALTATRSHAALPVRQPSAILTRPAHVITDLPAVHEGPAARP